MKNFVSDSKESTRMFKSSLLESVSKVHFSIPLIIYVPVIFYLLWTGIAVGKFQSDNFLIEFWIRLAFLDRNRIFIAPVCISLCTGLEVGPTTPLYFSWRASRLPQ